MLPKVSRGVWSIGDSGVIGECACAPDGVEGDGIDRDVCNDDDNDGVSLTSP